jgi:hypothetical protein
MIGVLNNDNDTYNTISKVVKRKRIIRAQVLYSFPVPMNLLMRYSSKNEAQKE